MTCSEMIPHSIKHPGGDTSDKLDIGHKPLRIQTGYISSFQMVIPPPPFNSSFGLGPEVWATLEGDPQYLDIWPFDMMPQVTRVVATRFLIRWPVAC